jgi:hypothetical protein
VRSAVEVIRCGTGTSRGSSTWQSLCRFRRLARILRVFGMVNHKEGLICACSIAVDL